MKIKILDILGLVSGKTHLEDDFFSPIETVGGDLVSHPYSLTILCSWPKQN